MIHEPPKCSTEWTPEERCKLGAWVCWVALDRIRRDDPMLPVLAKEPTAALLFTMQVLLDAPAEVLEENREAFEKPYDDSKDRPDKAARDYWLNRRKDGGGVSLKPSRN